MSVKISELSASSLPLIGNEIIPLVRNGQTVNTAISSISVSTSTISALSANINSKVEEAPEDGLLYARKDGEWVETPLFELSEDGNLLVKMEISDTTGIVPDKNILGVYQEELTLGDSSTEGGLHVLDEYTITSRMGKVMCEILAGVRPRDVGEPSYNAGVFVFSTIDAMSGSMGVVTTTGYARLINADATLGPQVGTGVPNSSTNVAFPAGGGHRAYGVMSVANGGSLRSGNITDISSAGYPTYITSTGLSAVTSININYAFVADVDVSGFTSIGTLSMNHGKLRYLNVSNLSSVEIVDLQYSRLNKINFDNTPALGYVALNNNNLTELVIVDAPYVFSIVANNNKISKIQLQAPEAYEIILTSNLITTDALYDALVFAAGPLQLTLIDNPCEDLGEIGPALVDGILHTAVETEALISSSGSMVVLTNGILS